MTKGGVPMDDTENYEKDFKTCFKKYVCGMAAVSKKNMTKKEFLEMQKAMSEIYEEPRMKKILNINAVICVAAAIFLHAIWA